MIDEMTDRDIGDELRSRYWSKVEFGDGCWLWTGARNGDGYGSFCINRKAFGAHRVSWWMTNGKIPTGMQVLHRCDVRNCVRPCHLFLGNAKTNSLDMVAKGRQWLQKNRLAATESCRRMRERPGSRKSGSENPSAKLTADAVLEIRKLHASGKSACEIGRKFDVNESCIRLIVRRVTWRHIPVPTVGVI